MANRPRYSLKAMLVFIAMLSVPLAMIQGHGWEGLGVLLLFPVVGGAIGYLIDGMDGLEKGMIFGLLIGAAALFMIVPTIFRLLYRHR